MIPRLVIITEIIAPYRIPVFNALAARLEIEPYVIFLSENDPSLRLWRVYKDEIRFSYEVLPSWRQRFGRHNVLVNRGLVSALNRIKPTVVLCGGYNYLASWEAAGWARIHRVPLLLWSESTALDARRGHRPVEFLKTRFLSLCRGFVVSGKSSFRYLKDLGIPEQQIFTAPNAVDNQLFSVLADAARHDAIQVRTHHSLPARYFLYVGRLVEAKGVFDLLEAYARLREQIRTEVSLVFVGDGSDRTKLMGRSSEIAPGTILFPGFAHREELAEFYGLADALIFPTHSDPWGLVVNEAMSCGLPVVATSVAGCTEDLVRDGWNGFVIPTRDSSALAAAMERLAVDSALRIEMGAKSREKIGEHSPETWAQGLIDATKIDATKSVCE
ncbi:MAG: glycosyltransferase family 4 protein [Candidatus Sulfotelmatobacter sp.]